MDTSSHPPAAERRVRPRQGPRRRLGDGLFALLRWIARHVNGFHAAVGTFLLIGLGVILAASVVFARLAEEVAEGDTMGVDEQVLRWMDARASPLWDVVALEVTALGAGVVVWMVVLIASAFLWASRHRYSAALLWVAMIGGALLNYAMKVAFARPRPDVFEWRTPHAGSHSFPSGHSMTSMVVYGTLAFLIARLAPTPLLRRLTYGVAAVVILAVGLSRMYLGVHYPTDVFGGFVTGLAWAVTCGLGVEAVRYFRTRRPQVEQEEEDLDAPTAATRA